MIMSLIALGVVAGLGYLWATRGFFSALLNLICVVIAGAVAFGLWEPVAFLILASVEGAQDSRDAEPAAGSR